MTTINDIARYIIKAYPYPDELSKARLNKIIYLIDWKSAIENYIQITDINWIYNNYGPYVQEIEQILRQDNRFEIEHTYNSFGSEKYIFRLKADVNFNDLPENIKTIVDFVIEKTQRLGWGKFIQLVYSTFPIISQLKGSNLNLVELAKEYRPIREERTIFFNQSVSEQKIQ